MAACCACRLPRPATASSDRPETVSGAPELRAAACCAARAATNATRAAPPQLLMPTNVGGPLPMVARSGRDKQRYTQDGARLVAGCIPVRPRPGAPGGGGGCMEDLQVLLVSSRGGKGWSLPKGGWEDDESVETAAKRETVEEAGVRGTLELPQVGAFQFQSGKQPRPGGGREGRCVAHLFVLHVAEELEEWPERAARERRWMTVPEAAASCRHQWMRDALRQWAASKGWSLPNGAGPDASPPARSESGSTV